MLRPLAVILPLAAVAAMGLGACESKDRNAHDDVFEAGEGNMNEKLDAYAAEAEEAATGSDGAELEGAEPAAPEGSPGGEAPAGDGAAKP